MKRVDISEATASLAEYAKTANGDTVVVTVNGQPIVAVVPIPNADLETVSLSSNPKFLSILERSRASYRAQGGISLKDLEREFADSSDP